MWCDESEQIIKKFCFVCDCFRLSWISWLRHLFIIVWWRFVFKNNIFLVLLFIWVIKSLFQFDLHLWFWFQKEKVENHIGFTRKYLACNKWEFMSSIMAVFFSRHFYYVWYHFTHFFSVKTRLNRTYNSVTCLFPSLTSLIISLSSRTASRVACPDSIKSYICDFWPKFILNP